MRVSKKFSIVTVAMAVLALAISSIAQAKQSNFKTKIKNFGCINENFFRGAQPKDSDYQDLATMGVKTIIDLRDDSERNEEQLVEFAKAPECPPLKSDDMAKIDNLYSEDFGIEEEPPKFKGTMELPKETAAA